MDIKFECSKEDLVGAHLAGLGEDPKIKLRRLGFVLLPIVLMTVLALVCQGLFQLFSPNTILLPIVLVGFAALYLWAVSSNRHHRARAAVAEQLSKSGESIFGPYEIEVQDEGLLIKHNGARFWKWTEIKSILANADYCRIDIPGQESIILGASKAGSQEFFELFVKFCNTLHFYGQRGIFKQPAEIVPDKDILGGNVWETSERRTDFKDVTRQERSKTGGKRAVISSLATSGPGTSWGCHPIFTWWLRRGTLRR